jgi:hypothetical protein
MESSSKHTNGNERYYNEEPPRYEPHYNGSASGREQAPSEPNSPAATGGHDDHSRYALQVQRSCKEALRRMKQDNVLAHSNWAGPLTAAPAAISAMAFLLKTAANRKAVGLTVSSTDVKDPQGNKVGELP